MLVLAHNYITQHVPVFIFDVMPADGLIYDHGFHFITILYGEKTLFFAVLSINETAAMETQIICNGTIAIDFGKVI